ncbi:hypothetical protein [Chryseobacterium arthrosphaerae]|uniref:Uncharacterized protein n=1 Tax=Chryseobacterium arthrosphaerae TaxID=651561 RepID=A0A1B8ZQ50_9FLAO|nr:hypothetical protein [Chryseobacterium arthrosphaerae]OCA73721.1 hypothetical protein BBI00_04895 [Chryseobacterium arthrosphaerae]
MNSNEFRLGNYINFGSTLSEITGIMAEEIMFRYKSGGENRYALLQTPGINLIPLTEEWLLGFGFESNDGTKYNPSDEYASQFEYTLDSGISHRDFVCRPSKGWIIKLGDYDDELEVKYVHEFQNLFYALKGKELYLKKNDHE